MPRPLIERNFSGPLLTFSLAKEKPRSISVLRLGTNRGSDGRQFLLHAAWPGMAIPGAADRQYNLSGAYLAGAKWQGLSLTSCKIETCDLRDSDLSGVALDGAAAAGACFSRSTLRQASLKRIAATKADFSSAVLNLVQANFAMLDLPERTNVR